MTTPFYTSINNDFILYQGNCLDVLNNLTAKADIIFADPPYFLSNGGISYKNGRIVCVNKGEWDVSQGREKDNEFNREWLTACRRVLKDDGTIWITGTLHNIFSIANNLQELGFKILNVLTWAKTNPPPSIAHRTFTYSSEILIWAKKNPAGRHFYNYDLMKELNGGQEMTDVWKLAAVAKWEKHCGKHPTQKPLGLLSRILLSSTREHDLVLDPFAGSSTTGIAANLLNRRFIGIEQETNFLKLSVNRRLEIENPETAKEFLFKLLENPEETTVLVNHVRKSLWNKMVQTGICYLRAGDSKGSLLVKPGFERLNYVLLHTNGDNPMMFKLRTRGHFQIWTIDTLRKYGFEPTHAPYYVVLLFDKMHPVKIDNFEHKYRQKATFTPHIRPLSQFLR